MTSRMVARVRPLLESLSAATDDEEDLRLQKTLLVGSAMMMSLGGVIWGLFMHVIDRHDAALIPWSYTALTAVNIVTYRLTSHYGVFRTVQLLLTLLLPLLLQLALGGFAASGAVVSWCVLAPTGALLFCDEPRARLWFVGFVGAVACAAIVDGHLDASRPVPVGATYNTFAAMNLVVPTFAVFILLRHFVLQKDEAMARLSEEQKKSENLLLNVLPAEIAAILKDSDRTIADQFDDVSVLFADIVGFTRLSETLPPVEMITALNEIFSYFDALAEKHGVEKIRTIGDNYMAASGVPRRRADHAHALVAMALEMNEYLHRGDNAVRGNFEFRIGINSGPAVAGVIGQKKFHYDLWGDSVNIASRMESHGVPGRVQIGRRTYDLIRDAYDCEARGEIEVKGKGRMDTWFVLGPRQAA